MDFWVLPSLMSFIVLAGLCTYVTIRRPPEPMWPHLLFALIAPLIFATGDILSFLIRDGWQVLVPFLVAYTGLIFFPPTWWSLIISFARANGQPFEWENKYTTYWPYAMAGILWSIMITNPWHGLFLTQIIGARSEYHLLWWFHLVFCYVVILGSIALCFAMALKVASRPIRRRVILMLVAPIVTCLANFTYILPNVYLPFDPTVLGFSLSGVLFLGGIYQTGMFALSPRAISSIVERLPNGIVLLDKKGFVLSWNESALGIIKEPIERIEIPFLEWMAPKLAYSTPTSRSATPTAKVLEEILSGTGTHREDKFEYFARGSSAWIRLDLIDLSDTISRVSHCLKIEDITEEHQSQLDQLKMQEKIAAAQKQDGLAVLAGGVAHDYNNLLMAMSGNLELILLEESLPESVERRLASIDGSVERASRLTQKLLSYAGQVSTEVSKITTYHLVEETRAILEPVLISRGLVFKSYLTEGLWVSVDQAQLEQVITNLVLNAADASIENGQAVSIRTGEWCAKSAGTCTYQTGDLETDVEYVFIEVEDKGRGMPLDMVDRVFDPFYTTKENGHGLGLAAVKGIVHAHSGVLQVHSSMRQGSVFRILLPKATSHDDDVSSSNRLGQPTAKVVLVVDDDASVREVTGDLLKQMDILPIYAHDAYKAIQHMDGQITAALTIDAVILDVAMPGMDGFALMDHLNTKYPGLPIVVMSGHEREVFPEFELRSSVTLLKKPFSGHALKQALIDVETKG